MEGHFFGTGGLIRAYSDTLLLAVEESEKIQIIPGDVYGICIKYNDLDIFKHYCKNKEIEIKQYEYLQNVECKITVNNQQKQEILEDYEAKKIQIEDLKYICKKYITKKI